MSKEKTIGLSVLGGLMMTLAGTVAMRMSMARDDVASGLRDAPDAVAESHAPYKPSKLLNRLNAEPMTSTPTKSKEHTPSRHEEPRALAEQAPQAVGDRYAMPAMAELATVEATPNEPAMPVLATTPVEEPETDVARHSADPFHAASLGEPLPLAEATPPQEHMPSHAGVSEIMAPTPSHMHAHEASPAHGLLAVEAEPALQASHEGTHSGNVQHAVPTASNFIQSHTHAPTTQPAQDPYAPGHNGNPGAAAPSNMGSRYGAPAQHPSAPHYDIYGRDVPVEADPPPANRQYQPPATHQPSHQYSAVEERYEPELERMIPGMPHHAHSGSEDYTIRPNDSFYTISERVYGSGSYFKALEEHNRQRVPYSDRMRVGDVINTPRIEVLEEKYPDLCPKRRAAPPATSQSLLTSAGSHGIPGGKVYVVEQGDTLFDIARNELGKASRWSEIYELNRHRLGSDIDYLAPGTELVLPNAAAPVREPLTTERQRANATR